ncbi:Hypothetical protein R9X50_00346600 [Acrodontium crateriforme]|uniref:Uncharacterized protein n=1 Tax=Acrodontium crateriforme TaxID=150365 RepID=A0AAQ3R493_9PEZI|nr:Hypothetical protein R9X50_00346600 [Acrodontium crateriforme]
MADQRDVEMQYQPAEAMTMEAGQAAPAAETTEENKPKRTFLGMRGGGIILDLCACFICCECVEGCCNALDDCCCC